MPDWGTQNRSLQPFVKQGATFQLPLDQGVTGPIRLSSRADQIMLRPNMPVVAGVADPGPGGRRAGTGVSDPDDRSI